MAAKVLASLVADVIERKDRVDLDADATQRFHREFKSDVTESMESLRAEKRKAYEEAKNITIR